MTSQYHIEVKDYVVLQKPHGQVTTVTLIMDFTTWTVTHVRLGCSHLPDIRLDSQLTHTRRSEGAPDPDGTLKESAGLKCVTNRRIYSNRPDLLAFLSLAVDTSDRLYDDFIRLLFLHALREASALANELLGVIASTTHCVLSRSRVPGKGKQRIVQALCSLNEATVKRQTTYEHLRMLKSVVKPQDFNEC